MSSSVRGKHIEERRTRKSDGPRRLARVESHHDEADVGVLVAITQCVSHLRDTLGFSHFPGISGPPKEFLPGSGIPRTRGLFGFNRILRMADEWRGCDRSCVCKCA